MKKSLVIMMLFGLFSASLFSTSVGWGNLQWPFNLSVVQGETTDNIYGQVWMGGVTDAPGEGVDITAELGYGADGTTPDETWTWNAAAYWGDAGANDEYAYALECTMDAGDYGYSYRYQYTGETDYYYASEIGNLTVSDAPLPTYDVTFRVDMQNQTVSGDGVHIAGSFQGWDPAATELLDPEMDNIYSVTVELEAGTYNFKYVNGNAWGQDEGVPEECNVGGNREAVTPDEDLVLDIVCYGECGACSNLTAQDVTVTFQVNVAALDPGWYAGGVAVQGNIAPLDWNAGSNLLTDPDMDMIYTGDVVFPAGTFPDVEYKFTRDDGSRAWQWEDSNNRPFTIDDSGATQVLAVDYWNDAVPVPVNLVLEISGLDAVLTWEAVSGATGYNVYRSEDPYGEFIRINLGTVTAETYTDLNAGTIDKYFYEVKAIVE